MYIPLKYRKKSRRMKVFLIGLKGILFILGVILAYLIGSCLTETLTNVLSPITLQYTEYIIFLLLYLIEIFLIDRLSKKFELNMQWKLVRKLKNILLDAIAEIQRIKEEANKIMKIE